MRVEGNEVSSLHRQTRSTGNGSLASSIKRVTYQREREELPGGRRVGETYRGWLRSRVHPEILGLESGEFRPN